VAGATVVIDRSLLPEPHGIAVNGQRCEGEFSITTGVETDLVLTVGSGGCRVTTIASHPDGAQLHGNEAATISGEAPRGSQISIRPVEPGVVTAPRILPADESGFFFVESLPAGRYEVSLVVRGAVVETTEIELRAGEERHLVLSVPSE
jgi:hypothetical protein